MNNDKPKFKRQSPPKASGKKGKAKLKGKGWRRPRGIYSHQRDAYKYSGNTPKIGYGQAKCGQGLHPSGLIEVMVKNAKDVGAIDPKKSIARIASSVSAKKRAEIIKAAEAISLRVANKMTNKKARKRKIKKAAEPKKEAATESVKDKEKKVEKEGKKIEKKK